ncbi:hypothetical protein L6452_40342 [Arctium lappa]|uniref:Uncharacterized protein n=1 Tax=Arctium lappa TaxID=4217 RepID=A0ACB8XLL8_ARCLA|nr:hypothetical protein L6452_40342 [Arctium lappa]
MINETQWTGSLQLQMRMLGLHQDPYLRPHLISQEPVLDHDLSAEWRGCAFDQIFPFDGHGLSPGLVF